MSDLDAENLKQEKKSQKTPLTVNVSNNENTNSHSNIDASRNQSKKKSNLKIFIIGGAALVLIILTIVLSVTLTKEDSPGHKTIPDPIVPPPIPDITVSPFQVQETNNFVLDSTPTSNDWVQSTIIKFTPPGENLQSSLEERLLGDPRDGHLYQPVNPRNIPMGENNQQDTSFILDFGLIDNYQVQLIIKNPNDANQFRVPDTVFQRPILSFEARFTQVGFLQATTGAYHFNFSDIYTGETLISTYKRKLVIEEKFQEIGFVLPSQRIFGLGQHNSQFQLQNGTYTLWARERQNGLPDDNAEGGLNGPHIHPFLLVQTQNKDFFGMFFLGSSASTFEIIYYPGTEQTVLNYISLGGQMEMYFIMRGTAQEIISKYHALIGYSMMPPYYALGFFQGSNAYTSQKMVEDVIAGYADMMLEGIIIDNYNEAPNHPFTVNQETFPYLNVLKSALLANNQHIYLGVQSAVDSKGYYIYDDLVSSKCMVQSALTQVPLVGVQGTTVVYPDYFCDDIADVLEDGLSTLFSQVNYEGIILQGNHPLSYVSGEVLPPGQSKHLEGTQYSEDTSGNWSESYQINQNQAQLTTYGVPFVPGFFYSGPLDNMTISLNATHSGGLREYDLHNLNGFMNTQRVYLKIKEVTDQSDTSHRFMLFSDSSFAGSGKFSGIALTNMERKWSNLRNVVSQVMSFSMFGVSNVAVDSCGGFGYLDHELCGRWAQLAAFMPLMRNYYNATYNEWQNGVNVQMTNPPSEFYAFTDEFFEYKFMSAAAVSQRLQYSRYIYSQMYKVYRYGGSLVYPLFFDYPNDDMCFDNAEDTYMLGDSIKVSPVLDQGITGDYDVYFPEGIWADLNRINQTINSTGQMVTLQANDAFTNIHLKAGRIIPFQLNTNPQSIKRTKNFTDDLSMSFIIHRDASQYAEGYTLVDDGITAKTWDNIFFSFWKLRYASKSINFWVDWGDDTYSPPNIVDQLSSITIVQADDLADTDFACYMGKGLNAVNMSKEYNPYTNTLKIWPFDNQPLAFQDIGFIKFGNSKHEPNFCVPQTAFSYKVTHIDPAQWLDQQITVTLQSMQGTKFLDELIFTATLLDDFGTININITTTADVNSGGNQKFKVPYVTNFAGFKQPTKLLRDFFEIKSNPFSYSIFEEANPSNVLFQTDPNKFYFDDYMVFDSAIFSLNVENGYPLMGMGERAGSLFYTNEQGGIHSRYTFDQANPIDDGLPPGKNMYGYQPFYVYQSVGTQWVGVFDLSTYATDYVLDFNNGVNTQITKIVIGGSIQKYFFVGAKPDDVIKTYSQLVGMQTMPPLWSFGWQQCRFGWKTDSDWQNVVDSYEANDLPLDTMWADIDYMDDYKIFTVSQTRYANLASQVKNIRENKNMTFVPIMDVGVAVRPNNNYYAYDQGMEQNIFIKVSDGSSPLTAGVWPGHAYFPDFWHENISNYWSQSFQNLTTNYQLDFDGIWIDMNEATNFCNGYCIPSERPVDSLRNKPYYVPGWRDLEDKALGVDGVHANGWHEYDLHSTYSLLQVKATSEFLINKGIRPYVLSRSNFPGLSEYGYHWMGDNWSTVEYMQYSVDGMYHYQLFALPFSGSDICGFDGDAIPTLCTRWHQLGSLYPFARNHNQNASIDQEPYIFTQVYDSDSGTTYMDLIRTALRNRYSFIKYYYSHFYDLSVEGGSFFKPLFFEFPNDPVAYTNIQKNIMLGESLKASIEVTTLVEGNVDFYFPAASWCQILPTLGACFQSTGQIQTLPSMLSDYYIHMREGGVMPFQDAQLNKVHTTKDLLSINTDLYIFPLVANTGMSTMTTPTTMAAAVGYLYLDNGVGFADASTRFDFIFSIGTNTGVLTVSQVTNGYARTDNREEFIGDIRILFASKRGLNKIVGAQVKENGTGTIIDLQTPVWDDISDSVVIVATNKADNSRVSLYDINTITFA